MSFHGGTPPHFIEPKLCRGASSLTTQDLLQPLERANSPKYQDSQVLHPDKSTKDESFSQHTIIPTTVTVDRLLPLCMGSQMNLAIEVSSQLLRLAGADGNVQGFGCKPQMSLSAPSPAREEHLLVESTRSSDVTAEQEHVENHRCGSNPQINYGLSDLLYAPNGSSDHGPLEGGYQPIPVLSRLWQKASHPFVEVTKTPIKGTLEDDEDDVEGSDRPKEQRKKTLFDKAEEASRDCKNLDASTPRSKHSSTEQRRRSKINDRFQMLRNLVPRSDQKRDKASFLLEVIEYVQMLQEKVLKYEGVEQGRRKERLKNMVWETCKKSAGQEAFLRDAVTMDSALMLRDISSAGLAIHVKEISETPRDLLRPKLVFSPSESEKGSLTADFRPCVGQQNASYANGRSAVINNGFDSSHDKTTCKCGIAKPNSKLSFGQRHANHSSLPAALVLPLSTPDSQTFAYLPKTCATTRNTDESAHPAEETMSVVDVTETSQASKDAKHHVQFAVAGKLCRPQEGCGLQVVGLTTAPDRSVTSDSLQGPSSGTFGSEQMPQRYHVNGVTATNKNEVSRATPIRDESLAVTGGHD